MGKKWRFFPLQKAQRGLESDNLSLAEKKSLLGLWRAWNREWFAPDAGKRHGAFTYADCVLVSLLALACLCPLPSSLAKLQSGREHGCRRAVAGSALLGKGPIFFFFFFLFLFQKDLRELIGALVSVVFESGLYLSQLNCEFPCSSRNLRSVRSPKHTCTVILRTTLGLECIYAPYSVLSM